MILARIDGHVTTSFGDRSLKGQTIVLCTPVDEQGKQSRSISWLRSLRVARGCWSARWAPKS